MPPSRPTSPAPSHAPNLAPSFAPHDAAPDRAEWVLANALGGFAMGSACARDDRRYHAMLVCATQPPVGRVVALKNVADTIVFTQHPGAPRRLPLTDFAFANWPCAHSTLTPEFERQVDFCRWTWRDPQTGVEIVRELCLADGLNAARLTYLIRNETPGVLLELRPLIALRDFHCLLREQDDPSRFRVEARDVRHIAVHAHALGLDLHANVGTFDASPAWWRNFEYARDIQRGQDGVEDLFCPGTFTLDPAKDSSHFKLLAWMGEAPPPDLSRLTRADRLAHAARHIGAHIPAQIPDAALLHLIRAADQFVVRRRAPAGQEPAWLTSVIAGYPWFGDWGRDTCICLRGLLLTTGRFNEALETLRAFAQRLRRGLIPNCFDDGSGDPQYNTVDAPLWYVLAACEFLRVSGDHAAFVAHLLGPCHAIIDAYTHGTDYGIRLDTDGLITAGDAHTQLTWMDAKRDATVFTPRHGKAVEINALWHAALLDLAQAGSPRADALRALAARARLAFDAFWNPRASCLFDVITSEGGRDIPNDDIRPNQVFAVALPHSPLSRERQHAVLGAVRDHLLTPRGLRTLAPGSPAYRPRFEGNLYERDGAYHNGTVWPWLIGPYAEGLLRAGEFAPRSRREAMEAIKPLLGQIVAPAPGEPIATIAEVYDADPPRRPDGCPAQAWSVAEVLRVLVLASREG